MLRWGQCQATPKMLINNSEWEVVPEVLGGSGQGRRAGRTQRGFPGPGYP